MLQERKAKAKVERTGGVGGVRMMGVQFDTVNTVGGSSEVADDRREARAGGTIVLVDHRTLIRECLTHCLRRLSPNDTIVAVATVGEWIGQGHCDPGAIVLCVDRDSATRAVIDETRLALAQARCSAPVAVLADGENANLILELLEAGAKGFIPTSVSLEVAIEAMRLVRAGGTFVPASSLLASRSMIEQPALRMKPRADNIFTERQSAVVEMLRQGKANKIIAYELNMRESTVKVHIRNIMRKLHATNRTQVAYLYQSMMPQDLSHPNRSAYPASPNS